MKQFHDLYAHVLNFGEHKPNRTGVDTISVFGHSMRFDLREGFPLVTGKFVKFHNVLTELLWFLRGEQTLDFMHAHNCHIWDAWAKEDWRVGPVYGFQWRNWPNWLGYTYKGFEDRGPNEKKGERPLRIDQLQDVIDRLKRDPLDRRLIVSAWNPSDIPAMALPPCHVLFQFNAVAKPDGTGHWLDLQLYQRSADTFIGVPYNVASYALLLTMVAHIMPEEMAFQPRHFIWTGGDVHIYSNHREQIVEYLSRDTHPLPRLEIIREVDSIDDFRHEDFLLYNYKHSGVIKAEVAV